MFVYFVIVSIVFLALRDFGGRCFISTVLLLYYYYYIIIIIITRHDCDFPYIYVIFMHHTWFRYWSMKIHVLASSKMGTYQDCDSNDPISMPHITFLSCGFLMRFVTFYVNTILKKQLLEVELAYINRWCRKLNFPCHVLILRTKRNCHESAAWHCSKGHIAMFSYSLVCLGFNRTKQHFLRDILSDLSK